MREQKSRRIKAVQILWIVLFIMISLVPSLGMAAAGETKPSANEILASRPVLVQKNGGLNTAYLGEVSEYLADRFAFRKGLVNAWAVMNAKLFHSSAEEQVVLGKNGWLYYQPTLDDYMGRAMSDEELARAADNLAAFQREAESRGVRFVFTIAPNKNSLYGGNMPAYIPENHADSNAVRIKPYLERSRVNYVDLFESFSESSETLYYRSDSHWTDRGAALAADALLAAMDKDGAYFAGPFADGERHRGDLYEMLYPTGKETEACQIYAPGFAFTLSDDPNGGNAMKIRSSREGKSGTLLCWRDSFGISLYPYLADSFENALFLRSATYDLSQIDDTGADVVLIELVERNLDQLADADRFRMS